MDKTLRQNIISELTSYLNRAPTEDEIMNAQTDLHIMGRIRDKKINTISTDINAIGVATKVTVERAPL